MCKVSVYLKGVKVQHQEIVSESIEHNGDHRKDPSAELKFTYEKVAPD